MLTYALVGRLGEDVHALREHGLAGYVEIAPELPVEESIRDAAGHLERATAALVSNLI